MRKLTLSAEGEVIDMAKELAIAHGTSISEMFSQLVRSMAVSERPRKGASKTRLASGLVKLPSGKTDRELIEEAVAERFAR